MERLALVDPATATGRTRELFDLVQHRFGRIPNAMKVLAHSPAAFDAWWAFDVALADSSLPRTWQEQIAVLVASRNACDYCLRAHTAAARAVGVGAADLVAARRGAAAEPQAAAALRFASDAIRTGGAVADEELQLARDAGLADGQLIEILAVVAINTFNNSYNRFARPPHDFPPAPDALADPAASTAACGPPG